MLNSYVNFILLAAIISVPFYFQYWIRNRETTVVSEINSQSSKLTVLTLGLMIISSFLSTHQKTDARAIVMFGASFLSIMLIFSFRSKAVQQVRKIEITPKERLIHSVRSFLAFGGTLGLYYSIIFVVGAWIGTLPAVAIAMTVMIATAPLMVRVWFSCNRMYPSELKNQILQIFEKAGVQIGEIYLMNTDKMKMSNALVCGSKFAPGPMKRSLFLSQNLFETLDEEELKAVICHEASHFQLHHIAKRAVFAMLVIVAALLCVGLPIGMVAISLPSKEWASALAIVNLVANLIFQYVFIFRVIRKHEFEADLNAVVLGASPYALVRALEKITEFNGASLTHTKEDFITKMVMGNAHPSLEERKEALYSHRLPKSARILPASRFVASYVAIVLVIGAWFVNVNKESVFEVNRVIASEKQESSH